MLIYAYADILGYRQMLSDRPIDELRAVLESAVSDMHRMLDLYTNSESVTEQYKSTLYNTREYLRLLLGNDEEKFELLREGVSGHAFKLKTYIAFDTIVVYWDEFYASEATMTLFLLAIDLLYLVLYEKGILIRGAIGATDDYFIGEEGSERLFIVKNIGIAASIEKNQDCANLIVFGEGLRECCRGLSASGLTDDPFARLDYYPDENRERFIQTHPDLPRIFFKDGFAERAVSGEGGVSVGDVFEGNPLARRATCVTI